MLWLQPNTDGPVHATHRNARTHATHATHARTHATQGDYRVSLGFRANVEGLLKEHKVNLMLVGHQHSYERSCPVFNGTCASDGVSGTTHMVVGSAGASHERGNFSKTLGNYSLKHVDDYGYIRSVEHPLPP